MRNILRISASDMKRIWTNVVAVVVIIGLSVIPCLYAWFNIFSNWDPYGADSTKNLQVAVVSSDEGVVLAGYDLNVGSMIVENLEANTTIGWVFVDTEDEAVAGVTAGDYYAALVVDDSFSENLISFLGGEPTNPHITYYVNEKKNAIAPKITNKVKNTVQEEVNKAFVGTLAGGLMKVSDFIMTVDDEGNINSYSISKLESLDTDLKTYISIIDSYIALMDSTDTIVESAKTVSDQMENMMDTAKASAVAMDSNVDGVQDRVNATSQLLMQKLDDLDKALTMAADLISYIKKNQDQSVTNTSFALRIQKEIDTINEKKEEIQTGTAPYDTMEQADKDRLVSELTAARDALVIMQSDVENQESYNDEEWNRLDASIRVCRDDIATIKAVYQNDLLPKINATMNSLQNVVTEVQGILNYSSGSINTAVVAINNYPKMTEMGKDSLLESRKQAQEMDEALTEVIDGLKGIDEESQYSMMLTLLQTDPEAISDFISNPVSLDTQEVYGIENNGSAAAPFYITLSIWVGALIMSTILKTNVKEIEGVNKARNYEKFFGRYVVTYLVGQIQTLITTVGAILYCGIQCPHPFFLILAGSWTAFIYSLLLYSFTYSFGNVGEALSVILMVIQVAGSGGTFPIEVLPKPFQLIYNYMPFMYSMNAMRECVGGFYKYDYWKYMAGLLIYVAVALFIGLILYFPCVKLNEMIEESKEKSDLLI